MNELRPRFRSAPRPGNRISKLPKADDALKHKIFDLVRNANQKSQLREGLYLAMESLREGVSAFLVFSEDAHHNAISLVKDLADNLKVPYVWVPSKVELSEVCGKKVIACSVINYPGSILEKEIDEIKAYLSQQMISEGGVSNASVQIR